MTEQEAQHDKARLSMSVAEGQQHKARFYHPNHQV
jgi:hypothetical protein